MQSGIRVSSNLQRDFNELLTETEHFGILVGIVGESLRTLEKLPTKSRDFAGNLAYLAEYLKPTEALYIILRRQWDEPHPGIRNDDFIAVTYVPDAAKVREKMLFASTRTTLVRELGQQHFSETLFATTAEELTAEGFARHRKHNEQEAPLTEEERTLNEVRRVEAEAGTGTGAKKIHLSTTMKMPISEDALGKMTEMGRNQGPGFFLLKVNPESEVVELASTTITSPTSVAELIKAIDPAQPRFTFWRYNHTHEGAELSPALFFYTCPSAAGKNIKHRMLYPLMKRAVIESAKSAAGLEVEKKFEVEEPTEITEDDILAELHPQAEVKSGFKRPKRPGR